MKTFGEWQESHFRENPDDKKLGHDALMNKFNAYIKKSLKKSDEPKQEKVNQKNSPSIEPSSTKSIEDKLDKQYKIMLEIYEQLNQINWAVRIGLALIAAVISGLIKPGIFSNLLP